MKKQIKEVDFRLQVIDKTIDNLIDALKGERISKDELLDTLHRISGSNLYSRSILNELLITIYHDN